MTMVATDNPPELGNLIEQLKHELDLDYVPPQVKRHAHPKMHGCLLARFKVHADVPEDLRHGLFARLGKEFRAWVRFSNAFGLEHDLKLESRGMAIKVLDVHGEHVRIPGGDELTFEDTTQDFVVSTHDVFPLKDAVGYERVAAAAREGLWALFKVFKARRNLKGFWALLRGGLVEARNPLTIKYNSQTAYKLGPWAVKVRARPIITKSLSGTLLGRLVFRAKVVAVNVILAFPLNKWTRLPLRLMGFAATRRAAEKFCERYIESSHYLRTMLEQSLARADATFVIEVQRQASDRSMPADDPRVRWREWRAPFRPVATLTIPRQVFWPAAGMPPNILRATIRMMENGENMSFNPWHALVEHEPLGLLNRARGEIYAAISKYRHTENDTPRPDPSTEYNDLRAAVLDGTIT